MRTQLGVERGARYGRARLRLLLTFVTAVLVLTAIMVSSAPATASNGMTQVSGIGYLEFLEECTAFPDMDGRNPDYSMIMEGDLAGCVYVYVDYDRSRCMPSGVYIEEGLEIYDILGGDLGLVGTFESDYRFQGKFGDCTDFGSEIFGRCQHPVALGRGTGDFANITGRLDFKDDVDLGCAYYRGHLRLP